MQLGAMIHVHDLQSLLWNKDLPKDFLENAVKTSAYVKIVLEIRKEKKEEKKTRFIQNIVPGLLKEPSEYKFSGLKDQNYCLRPSEDGIQQLKNSWTVTKDTVHLKQADVFPIKVVRTFLKVLKPCVPRSIKTYILGSQSCHLVYVSAYIGEHILCTTICTSRSLFSIFMPILHYFHFQNLRTSISGR